MGTGLGLGSGCMAKARTVVDKTFLWWQWL